ncbi:HET domain-containing protein [Fusarium sp. LHS14.1]|nr:HET domain-containing protein [Fusarium sp. LHS14.1]
MSRCEFCRAFTISVERHYLEFHPDLASLKRSAEEGCNFRLLCWTGFQQEWTTSQIEFVLKGKAPEGVSKFEPSIWIYVHFRDYNARQTQPKISVYCGRVSPLLGQRESSFGLNHINVSVYGEEGTLAGSRTPGRICTAEHGPDTYITMIRQFLQGCRKFHRGCNFKGTYRMPTRVIDVGNPQQRRLPRLIITSPSMEDKYLALSYCWGPATDTYALNASTMEDMLNGMDESRLVAAHRDTMSLARSLGVQFVWIDALCIIQGNKEDWERESNLMARVYGNSTLTVSAGRSADARNSFIINNYKQPAPCCEIPLDEGQGNVLVGLRRSSDYGVVETRGWCLQEKKWSRRIVFFGKEQLCFSCRYCSYSEDHNYEEEKPSSLHAILGQAYKDMSQKRPGPGMLRQKTLLGRKVLKEDALSSDMALFVALGAFDLAEESVQEVWCLQLTVEEGLILRKGDDGRFQRLGLFQLYKMDWFDNVGDSEVMLV